MYFIVNTPNVQPANGFEFDMHAIHLCNCHKLEHMYYYGALLLFLVSSSINLSFFYSGPRTKSHPDLDGSISDWVVGQRLQVQSWFPKESKKVTAQDPGWIWTFQPFWPKRFSSNQSIYYLYKLGVITSIHSCSFGAFPNDYSMYCFRFNVSLTRAQGLLVVVGNPSLLSVDSNWKIFVDYVIKNGKRIQPKNLFLSI